jgi:hypothetical protein
MYHDIPINTDKYKQFIVRSSTPVGIEVKPAARRSIPDNLNIPCNNLYQQNINIRALFLSVLLSYPYYPYS